MKSLWLCLLSVSTLLGPCLTTAEEVTLALTIERALAHSFSLQRAGLDVESRVAALEQARASRLPEIGIQLISSYLTNPPEGISVLPGAFGYLEDPSSTYPIPLPDTEMVLLPDAEHTYFQLKADLLWPLFTWGKLESAEQIAQLDVSAARIGSERVRAECIRDVSRSYYGLRLSVESEVILTEARAVYAEIVADRERAFEAGVVNLESLLEAQASLRSLEGQVQVAAEGRRSAAAALRLLTGHAPEPVPVSSWREAVPDLVTPELAGKAIRWSPELREIGLHSAQADLLVDVNEGSRLWRPDLALAVSVETSGSRVPLSANWRAEWDTGVTVSLVADAPAWDWGKREAAVRESSLMAQVARLGEDELSASLDTAVQRAIEQVISAHAYLTEKQASEAVAAERRRNAQVSFDNDVISREQNLGSQVLLLTAQLETVAAGFAVESALLDLEFLIGEPVN